jgi:hypothetical protein
MVKAVLLGEWDFGGYNHNHLNAYEGEGNGKFYIDNVTDDEGLMISVNGEIINVIELGEHLCPPKVISEVQND